MSHSASIKICEIFGPTIQGEGSLIGQPTVFVRTGGCDYHCRWCDTPYAVDSRFRDTWTDMSAEKILEQVERLSGGQPMMISLSGGNPALQPLEGLIPLGRDAGYRFAMETQGSIVKPWFSCLEVLTLSPKPPSSGMKTDWKKLQECVDAAGAAAVSLKLVVLDEADYQFARQAAARFPQLPIFLQPCNMSADVNVDGSQASLEQLRWLVARVLADGWYAARVLPQLHVLLWSNKRGR
ncbi:MAG: 7-carboxy-7-deazaguanine synthase QueE [Proteobacteria bacterium]|nr:7-carboxy-7-deazaguanine synthase QueE [Pseudomonadota bacterium]